MALPSGLSENNRNRYNIISLEFSIDHLADLSFAKRDMRLGSEDILATKPPFGSDIPITDRHILVQYE
jgi:type I restriction enzyme M protein